MVTSLMTALAMIGNPANINLSSPTVIDTLTSSPAFDSGVDFFCLSPDENWLYASCGSDGVAVIDLTDPANPAFDNRITNATHMTTSALCLFALGDYLYIGDSSGSGGIVVYDVSDPQSPTFVSNFNTSSDPHAIFVVGTYLYAIEGGNNLEIVDYSTPGSPSQAGTITDLTYLGGGSSAIVVVGNYAYTADSARFFAVWDISTPGSISRVSQQAIDDDANAILIEGNYAYVAYDQGFAVFDISTPTAVGAAVGAITNDTSLNSATKKTGIAKDGNYIYTTYPDTNTLQIFDVSVPASPSKFASLVDATNLESCLGMVMKGKYIYSGTGTSTGADVVTTVKRY